MAHATGLDLGHPGELVARRDIVHHGVAAGAPHVARVVRAALPEEVRPLRVAGGAHGVALLDRRLVVLGEGDHPAHAFTAARLDVLLPGPVTGLAAQALHHVAGL